jgi:branched-chain amino acid transport system substrate-binding protein
MPYKSSLTGQTSTALAAAYESSTGNQWTQAIGSTYALFEIAKEAFGSVSDPHDAKDVAAALHTVNYTGMCGPLNFGASSAPAPGVGVIPPVGVQWKKSSGKYPFEMKVVDNSLNKSVPIGASLDPTYA